MIMFVDLSVRDQDMSWFVVRRKYVVRVKDELVCGVKQVSCLRSDDLVHLEQAQVWNRVVFIVIYRAKTFTVITA
jgi:hypothetical protein